MRKKLFISGLICLFVMILCLPQFGYAQETCGIYEGKIKVNSKLFSWDGSDKGKFKGKADVQMEVQLPGAFQFEGEGDNFVIKGAAPTGEQAFEGDLMIDGEPVIADCHMVGTYKIKKDGDKVIIKGQFVGITPDGVISGEIKGNFKLVEVCNI
ncbi:hypothetical protein ACFL6B_01060 [Thermodesulfobacteriota bacterium]